MDAFDYIFIGFLIAIWCVYDEFKNRKINEQLEEIKAECKAKCNDEMVGDDK